MLVIVVVFGVIVVVHVVLIFGESSVVMFCSKLSS